TSPRGSPYYAEVGRLLALLALVALPRLVAAQDAFEIQVYDSATAAPATIGIELHVNAFAIGRRATSADGELPTHHVGHVTLEPHVGIASFAEVGFYLQTAVRPDGALDWAGAKGRLKLAWPRRLGGVVGLALNAEIAHVPAGY